jgi:CRISPR-associated protein Csm4
MRSLCVTLKPLSAFGGPIKGDTLFGHLCWAARNRHGEGRLRDLLAGYGEGRPFAVCADALPQGHLPRPAWPLHRFHLAGDRDRKAVKRLRWLPTSVVGEPLIHWLDHCRSDRQVLAAQGLKGDGLTRVHGQPHNSIDRRSGTTGGADFAPYSLPQHWHAAGARLDCWLLVDPERLEVDELGVLLDDIGRAGHGRDASIGLGKFAIETLTETPLPSQPDANACLTLAPCAPQGLGCDAGRSFYEPFTRFGRHGDSAVHGGRPFKAPVLLAQTGALLSPLALPAVGFIGQGLGGEGRLSNAIAATVQQGYAPFVGVHLPREEQP